MEPTGTYQRLSWHGFENFGDELNPLGRSCRNKSSQNPGMTKKGGGGSYPFQQKFAVDLIYCTEANLKW